MFLVGRKLNVIQSCLIFIPTIYLLYIGYISGLSVYVCFGRLALNSPVSTTFNLIMRSSQKDRMHTEHFGCNPVIGLPYWI